MKLSSTTAAFLAHLAIFFSPADAFGISADQQLAVSKKSFLYLPPSNKSPLLWLAASAIPEQQQEGSLPDSTHKNNDNDDVANSDNNSKIPPSSPAAVFGAPLDEATKRRNKRLIGAAKSFLFDVLFAGETVDRAYARFYALETIARMPYFSYLSVLHLYETLGWWRRADYIKLHFAESWNELHHLMVMEELGGNDRWADRFVAQHAAFFYYWMVVLAYMVNPSFAYNLNQAVEEHAHDTYDAFLTKNKEWLESQPAPDVAKLYYRDGDLYMFDEMHTSTSITGTTTTTAPAQQVVQRQQRRRPKCDTLYDVFVNVRDDELEHVKTMAYLQEQDADLVGANAVVVVNGSDTGDVGLLEGSSSSSKGLAST